VSLAREGAAKTQALIGKMSVPLSPIPGSRSRPGVAAQTASGAKTAIANAAPRGPRPQPAASPVKRGGKGVLIGVLAGLVIVAGGALAVLKPWQKPAPVESAQQSPAPADPAAVNPTTTAGGGTATDQAAANPSTSAPASVAPATVESAPANPAPTSGPEQPAANIPTPRQLMRDRITFNDMMGNVESARRQAVGAGATPGDLSAGDILVRSAATLARGRRFSDAMAPLTDASNAYIAAMSSARQRATAAAAQQQQQQLAQQQAAAPPPVTQAPVTAAPQPTTPAEPAVDDRGAIQLVVSEYFRAVSAGKIDRMKQLFPTMPNDMQSNYTELFKSGSSIDTSNWEVIGTDLSGAKATVQLNGQTVLHDKKGKVVSRSPAPRAVSLEKVAGTWRIADVHQ
jgi:hypothetical protein